jgi:hypothetical protein
MCWEAGMSLLSCLWARRLSRADAVPTRGGTNYRSQGARLRCILSMIFNSPTDAQVNCLKNNFKISIKTAPTCFGAVTPSSGAHYSCLLKLQLLK